MSNKLRTRSSTKLVQYEILTPWDNLANLYSPIPRSKEIECAQIIQNNPTSETYSDTFHILYFSITKYIIKLTVQLFFEQNYTINDIDDIVFLIYKRLHTSTPKYKGNIRYTTFAHRNIKSILCQIHKEHKRMKYISTDDTMLENIMEDGNNDKNKIKYSNLLSTTETPYSITEHNDMLNKIEDILYKLNDKDKDIVTSEETISVIGKKHGMSYEGVRLKKITLLNKIRRELEE